MMPSAPTSSHFLEKLWKAGPENGRMPKAVAAKAPTSTPTIELLAPRSAANSGTVAIAMKEAMLWKRFAKRSTTKA